MKYHKIVCKRVVAMQVTEENVRDAILGAAPSSKARSPDPSIFFHPSFAPWSTNQPFTPGKPLWIMRRRVPGNAPYSSPPWRS